MPVSALEKARAGKPRFERQLPEQRRQALIAATIECLKRYGQEGLSIRTISTQAGVSVGLINHHFPNKEELFRALAAKCRIARAGSGALPRSSSASGAARSSCSRRCSRAWPASPCSSC